jgi:hypothetical protein
MEGGAFSIQPWDFAFLIRTSSNSVSREFWILAAAL